MAIPVRSPAEIDAIARAGDVCARILGDLAARCVAGAVTRDLDAAAREMIREAGAEPIFAGYTAPSVQKPFPGCVCVSINEELVHGIPGERLVRPGDVVSLDLGLRLDGWCADCATTVLVEPVADEHRALHDATLDVLNAALRTLRPGVAWSSVVAAAGEVAARVEVRVIEPYAGHGIGRALHEPPRAPLLNGAGALEPGQDFVLRPGMVLTVEPIVVRGTGEAVGASDGWTVLAADRAVGCHEERMVAIVRDGFRALTASLELGRARGGV